MTLTWGHTNLLNCFSILAGTPALTSRNFKNKDFEYVVELLDRACVIAHEAKAKSGKKLVDFKATLQNDADVKAKVDTLQKEVNEFSLQFPMPGFEDH